MTNAMTPTTNDTDTIAGLRLRCRALEDKLHRYKAYPVLNIGITIGF